jgi:hypothetical protein
MRSNIRGEGMSMARILIVVGLALAALGVLWPWLRRLGLGHLPGDIYVRGEHTSFYFPITTCILVSVVVSIVLWLLHR